MPGVKFLGLAALAASASAQISESKIADVPGLSFRIAIPETQAAPFDVYLSIVAPVTTGWASIAWGGKMIGNPLTIGWANGDKAVVSSRWAKSRTAPAAYAGASYTVLPSTTANSTHWQLDVLCRGCSQWEGGKLDPNGPATFAWAKNTKGPSNTALNTSTISYHDSHGQFSHDLSLAKIPQSAFEALVGGGAPATSAAAPPSSTAAGGIQTSVVTLPVSSSLPVSSGVPVVSLTTTNAIPIVSLTTTNGLPIVSLTTTNGLPIVTLSTAPFPGIGEATTKDNVVVVATTVPTSSRAQASPSFSLINPSSAIIVTETIRVTTTKYATSSPVVPKTTSTRRRTTLTTSTRRALTTSTRRALTTSTRRVIATSTRRAPVVTVTVTRRPEVVKPKPTVVGRPPWAGPPGRVGPPRRGPWDEDEE
ncbi:hypothetical protein QBC39DRAFT_411741 [Podospora conica]|nr:hypothetical protein QBC39DRAFT_411741 [Schizothecium conicum]